MIPKEIKCSLKQARVLNDLDQAEAAKRIGITADTLRSWESGRTFPDVPKIKRIEDVYGVSYNQILFLPR